MSAAAADPPVNMRDVPMPAASVAPIPSSSPAAASAVAAGGVLLDFPRVVSSLVERAAGGGLEGRSLAALFAQHEWAERLRQRECALAARSDDIADPALVLASSRLDPFVRFHLVRLLRANRDIVFYCKQPQAAPTTGARDRAAASVPVAPNADVLASDSAAQLQYIGALCDALRQQQSANPLTAINGGITPVVTSDQTLLDESVSGRGGWVATGQGLLHQSSLSRFQLLSATLDSMNPDQMHVLATSIVVVASFKRRCRFLGVTEDDTASLRPFSTPGGKSASAAASAASNLGAPFLMFNLLESVGKFSMQSMVATTDHALDAAEQQLVLPHAPASSASAPSNSAGVLQTHVAKIMKLTPANAYRFLLILECRALITPIRLMDELGGSNQGAGWRWFLTHFAPSLHSAARGAASLTADIPFSSLGSLSADTPLQAFQTSIHGLYQYYRQANWKTVRRRLKVEKEREVDKIKRAATMTEKAAGEDDDEPMDIDEEEDDVEEKKPAAKSASKGKSEEGSSDVKSSAAWDSPSIYPKLDVRFGLDASQALTPSGEFIVNSSFTHQLYRLIQVRGVRGTTTADMHRQFKSYLTMKIIAVHVQTLVKNYDVKSIADQTGRTMAFRFFTADAFELFKQQHSGAPKMVPATSTTAVTENNARVETTAAEVARAAFAATAAASSAVATAATPTQATNSAGSLPVLPTIEASNESLIDLVTFAPMDPRGHQPSDPQGATSTAVPTDARAPLRTVQREMRALEIIRSSPDRMMRAIDVGRQLQESDDNDHTGISAKSLSRIWARLTSLHGLQQVRIAVPTQSDGFKSILLLLLADVNITAPAVKERAIAIAREISLTQRQRDSMGRRGHRLKRMTDLGSDTDDEDEEDEDGGGGDTKQVSFTEADIAKAAAEAEAESTILAAAESMGAVIPVPTPTKTKTEAAKTAAKSVEKKRQAKGWEELDSDDEVMKEVLWGMSQGLIRPRIARLRWALERMWTIYSTVDPAVKRFKTKEIEATQATSSNAGEGVNLAADVSAAAAAASSSDASSLHLPLPASASSLPAATGPSRSFSFTLLLSHMRLRDWLMLIGASEDDFKSELDITILFGSLANFELSVSDPQIAPWATRMLQRTRTTKAHKFREVCHLAEAMGLIADAQRSDDAAVVGSGLGYYLLEPRFTLMGQVHDMTTSDGRDEMWRRLQEACLRVQRHRLLPIGRNGDFPTDEGTAGKTTNPSGPTSPRLPPLESTSDIAIASLADPSTVGTDTQTSTVDASVSDAILRQFPQKKFPHLFRKAHWTMGKKIETAAVEQICRLCPPVGQAPLSSSSIVLIRKNFFTTVTNSMIACHLACHRYPFVREAFDRLSMMDGGTRVIFPFAGRNLPQPMKRRRRSAANKADEADAEDATEQDITNGANEGTDDANAQAAAAVKSRDTSIAPGAVHRQMTLTGEVVSTPARKPRGAKSTPKSSPKSSPKTSPKSSSKTAAQPAATTMQSVVRLQPLTRQTRVSASAAAASASASATTASAPSASAAVASSASSSPPAPAPASSPVPVSLRAQRDEDHIPQPLGIPFRRSTSQTAQQLIVISDSEDGDEEDEAHVDADAAPPSASKSSMQIDSVPPSTRKRAKSTRMRWTPEEDQKLTQVFNEWFLRFYAPSREEVGGAVPRPDSAQEEDAPTPNLHMFAAMRVKNRDSAACRRRLEVLRNKGLLPVLVALGPAGASTRRNLSMTHLSRQVHPSPLSMSLLHFLQMLFSHPADKPFHSEIATRIVGNFSDIAIDTVLKALKQDKWVTQTKSIDNQAGRSWKFSAGWHDTLKPIWIASEVFHVNREFLAPFLQLSHASTTLAPALSTPSASIDPHHFALGLNVRGGEVAAIFQLLADEQVELETQVKEIKEDECDVAVEVRSVPHIQTWIDVDQDIPSPSPMPKLSASSAIAAAAATAPLSSTFLRRHLQQPFSALTTVGLHDLNDLSEDLLLPLGPKPTTSGGEEDVDMTDINAFATSSASVVPAEYTPPSDWLDTPEVIAAQQHIRLIAEAAGVEGILWSDFHTGFLLQIGGALPAPPKPTAALSSASSLFEKALARALNATEVIRVMVYDVKERYVHESFSSRWVLPSFSDTVEADFTNTALLPHPWRGVDGNNNEEKLLMFTDAIMSHLLHHPGLTPQALQRQLAVLAPSELDYCLHYLLREDRISQTTLPVESASLFSQPFAWDGAKKRKRRRVQPGAETRNMQRYLFPTMRAFAV